MISRLLFRLAKTSLLGKVVGYGFAHFAFMIPVKRVRENGLILAFYHPKPAWSNHIVILPKKTIRTLLDLAEAAHRRYISAIFLAAQELVADPPFQGGYTLCVNGGPRQEVQQVHFHLFTGTPPVEKFSVEPDEAEVWSGEQLRVFHHPRPEWETHLVVSPRTDAPALSRFRAQDRSLIEEVVSSIRSLEEQFQLVARGYTLCVQETAPGERERFSCHIIAGRKLQGPKARDERPAAAHP